MSSASQSPESPDSGSSNQQWNTSDPLDFTSAGSNENDTQGRTVVVDCWESQDIMEKLISFAEEENILRIEGAIGFVSQVEFLNRQGAPLPVVQGDFQILTMEGNIVYPKNNGKNPASWANVALAGEVDFLGGTVKSLIARSHVQVILSTSGTSNLISIPTNDVTKDEVGGAYMVHMDAVSQMVNEFYEDTLKRFNQP